MKDYKKDKNYQKMARAIRRYDKQPRESFSERMEKWVTKEEKRPGNTPEQKERLKRIKEGIKIIKYRDEILKKYGWRGLDNISRKRPV